MFDVLKFRPDPIGVSNATDRYECRSALSLSRPAWASLALRPAGLLSRPRRPLSRGSNPRSYPHEPLVSYRINRQLSGWNLPPLVIRAFGAHCHNRTLWLYSRGVNEAFFAELSAWLAEAGLAGTPETDIVSGFCDRCVAAGLPFKEIFRGDISEFESHMPSHAVGSF
jgi:hypothetical protein